MILTASLRMPTVLYANSCFIWTITSTTFFGLEFFPLQNSESIAGTWNIVWITNFWMHLVKWWMWSHLTTTNIPNYKFTRSNDNNKHHNNTCVNIIYLTNIRFKRKLIDPIRIYIIQIIIIIKNKTRSSGREFLLFLVCAHISIKTDSLNFAINSFDFETVIR